MTVAQVLSLLLVAVGGTAVTLTKEPVLQALVSGVYGVTLAVAFLMLGAPGVAMAVVVVVMLAVPVMVLITMANVEGSQG